MSSLKKYFKNNLHIHSVPADGHCFFHCLLLATSEIYRKVDDPHKLKMVHFLRSSLAKYLDEKDENDKSTYDKLSRGTLKDFSTHLPELSLHSLQKLLRSNSPVGEHIYELVSEFLDIDLYIFHKDQLMIFDKDLLHKNRSSIIIFYDHMHYELCILKNNQGGWIYSFDPDHEIIQLINQDK
jgi:hypothetical protein